MRRSMRKEPAKEGEHDLIAFDRVNCSKNHFWCFDCGGAPHAPCSCELWQAWAGLVKKKTTIDIFTGKSDDAAVAALNDEWVTRNTKPCPKCKSPVLKDDGCNHMTCRIASCKHEWCWICEGPWKGTCAVRVRPCA